MTVDTKERVAALRKCLKEKNVDAFLIPSQDAHQSEYIAECDMRRHWISGFTGSAGFAIVSTDKAALFTDGRYFLQAEDQLDLTIWRLVKDGLPGEPTWKEYLVQEFEKKRIGLDPTLIQGDDARAITESLKSVGSTLVPLDQNLVDLAWGAARPHRPKNKVIVHPFEFAGKSIKDKLNDLQEHIKERKAYGVIVSALDEVAWLFNLRGSDVECNPVFFAYALVTQGSVTLYVNKDKVTPHVEQYLSDAGVIRKEYDDALEELKGLKTILSDKKLKLLVDGGTSLAVENAVGVENILEESSAISYAKAIKNDIELTGMRKCHLRDGAALVQYLAWLEQELKNGAKLDEVDGSDKLEQFRAAQNYFAGLSFDTISSTGSNGAIIHYKPEKGSCKIIDPKQIYLCDSGGQYKDGTTDVTRTFHFGTPTSHEKRCFTRVLQGHIAIDSAIFPKGITGFQLDLLARTALWKDGLDYRHGTGHGVGSFLNVHEGPHGISPRIGSNNTPLAAGMTVTNEPGYYEDGKFGIRIESVLLVRKADTPNNFGDRGYLSFENVTMAPICLKLIDTDLLSPEETDWVNKYHQECYEKLEPFLEGEALEWLKNETRPIQ